MVWVWQPSKLNSRQILNTQINTQEEKAFTERPVHQSSDSQLTVQPHRGHAEIINLKKKTFN